ncbi:MAG: GntR family transcriptional regulator [Nocardioides sp.]|uniref:GntR family transcriptional regulator n=1 Tax=Nocardioides sp. TaxID=35761 RepID=UPI0039E5F374
MTAIHQRVADVVFDKLHERIVGGQLAPGDRIDPTEVAASLGVSRTPVREALLQLEAQGLVERLPYRGVVVTAVDAADVEDIAALRIHLETMAVRAALPHLTEDDTRHMESIHRELLAAVASPDAQRSFSELNRDFHLTLYRAAGSPTLLRLISDLSARAERLRLHFDVRHGRAMDDHARILAACQTGDVDEAVAATRDHILGATLMMLPEDFRVTPGSVLDTALLQSGHDRQNNPSTTADLRR